MASSLTGSARRVDSGFCRCRWVTRGWSPAADLAAPGRGRLLRGAGEGRRGGPAAAQANMQTQAEADARVAEQKAAAQFTVGRTELQRIPARAPAAPEQQDADAPARARHRPAV